MMARRTMKPRMAAVVWLLLIAGIWVALAGISMLHGELPRKVFGARMFIGGCLVICFGVWLTAKAKSYVRPESVQEADEIPARVEDPVAREKAVVEHNERIIAYSKSTNHFGKVRAEDAAHLIPHPTILCRWNRTKQELDVMEAGAGWYFHGKQHAVWRADMDDPAGRDCAKCLVEDPYE